LLPEGDLDLWEQERRVRRDGEEFYEQRELVHNRSLRKTQRRTELVQNT
jgi:hypothetical protein